MEVLTVHQIQISPTTVAIMGIILALAAYLRSIAESRRQQRDEIRNGLHPISWPPDMKYTEIKLQALTRTWRILNFVVAPVLIIVGAMSAFRLYAQATLGLPATSPEWHSQVIFLMPWCDSIIFGTFSIMFIAFGIMHFVSQITEYRIAKLRAASQPAAEPAYR